MPLRGAKRSGVRTEPQYRQPRVLHDVLGNRATLEMRERQAQHHAAPRLDALVEDLLVAVPQRSDEQLVVAVDFAAPRGV